MILSKLQKQCLILQILWRQDILINKDVLYQFYDKKVDKEIMNGAGFEFWRKKVEDQDPKYLFLSKEYLMQKSADQIDDVQYPDSLKINNIPVTLKYHFEPNHPNDGLTASFSYAGLSQIKKESMDWLVPGMIREKVSTLIKAMPKPLRTQLGPVQKVVTEFLSEADYKAGFNDELTKFIRIKTNSSFRIENELIDNLPQHLKINYAILDQTGLEIDSSRDLVRLQKENEEIISEVMEEISFGIEVENLTYWPDFQIPETVEEVWHGETVRGFPSLISENNLVSLKVLDNYGDALQKKA